MRVCALCQKQQHRGARLQLLVHAPAVQQHVLHGHVVDEVGFPQRRIPLRLPRRTSAALARIMALQGVCQACAQALLTTFKAS